MSELRVLYEDNHLLVVDKPAGIATMGSEPSQPTMARLAAAYLKKKYHKPGNVYVGVVSRLDRLVSGVLVLARTSKAASRLSQQIREHRVEKCYLACVEGELTVQDGEWQEVRHWVYKDELQHRMRTAEPHSAGAKEARLELRVLAHLSTTSLLEVDLQTGRKHQIRLQLEALGHPVLGDLKYGATRPFSPGIALHCHRLKIVHPTRQESMEFRSCPTRHWRRKVPQQLLEKGLRSTRSS